MMVYNKFHSNLRQILKTCIWQCTQEISFIIIEVQIQHFLSSLLPLSMLIIWESGLNHAAMSAHDDLMCHCQIKSPECSVWILHRSTMMAFDFSGPARLKLDETISFTKHLGLYYACWIIIRHWTRSCHPSVQLLSDRNSWFQRCWSKRCNTAHCCLWDMTQKFTLFNWVSCFIWHNRRFRTEIPGLLSVPASDILNKRFPIMIQGTSVDYRRSRRFFHAHSSLFKHQIEVCNRCCEF